MRLFIVMKLQLWEIQISTFFRGNNQEDDQAVWLLKLISAFVVGIWQKKSFQDYAPFKVGKGLYVLNYRDIYMFKYILFVGNG